MSTASTTRRLARNSLVQAAAFAAQGVTEFVVALAIARFVGAERLGEFTTLVTLTGLFAFISSFGLPSLLTREIARIRDDRPRVKGITNATVGLVGALSGVAFFAMLGVGVASGYPAPLLRALLITAVALGVESASGVIAAPFRGFERLEQSSTVLAAMYLTFMVFALATIPFHGAIDLLMAAYLASRIVALAVAIWLYQSHFGRLRPRLDLFWWRTLLRNGVPFSVNSIFAFTYSRADVVLLSFLAGNTVVGFYTVAYGLTMRANIIARAVTFALYPLLSFQFTRDRRVMYTYTANGIHCLNIAGFLIAALLWGFGPDLVRLIYGTEFAAAAGPALRLLALAVPLRFLETSLGVSLDASNQAARRATGVIIAGITNVALNVLLIPPYRILGAVYATCLTEVVICAAYLWFLRRVLPEIIAWRAFRAPALGTLLILIGLAAFRQVNLFLAIAGSVALYVLVIFAVDQSSIQSLRQLALNREVS